MSVSAHPPSQVNHHQEESVTLSEATKRLYVQLAEAEKRHQQERDRLKVCISLHSDVGN